MISTLESGVSPEAVAWCYKLFLGREPANQKLVESHLARPSLENLRAFFVKHPEFQAYLATLPPKQKPAPKPPAGRLDYVVDRLARARFIEKPFRHLYIENLFSEKDFAELVSLPEIAGRKMDSDQALIAELERLHYRAIGFPGTTTDKKAYLAWHADPTAAKHGNQETCEGYGIVMRLKKYPPGSILEAADALFQSDRFWTTAAARFGLDATTLKRDYGLQKYLDGYEISPHPDIRTKALTFMANINPAANAESLSFHTHYLKFRPERAYVSKIWATDLAADRAWVPWEWCETVKIQTKNNSLVMFSPGNDTLHAVKASYNHLETQRTQFYGNLWHLNKTTTHATSFKKLAKMAAP